MKVALQQLKDTTRYNLYYLLRDRLSNIRISEFGQDGFVISNHSYPTFYHFLLVFKDITEVEFRDKWYNGNGAAHLMQTIILFCPHIIKFDMKIFLG